MNQSSTKKIIVAHEVICVMIIIAIIGYTLYAITLMPDMIPIHLTNGVVDGWGSKWISLVMPGIVVAIYVFSIIAIRYQKKHSKPVLFLSWVKLICVILFSVVSISFIQFALGR